MKILFIGILTEEVLAQARQERLIGSFVDVHEAAAEIGKICNAYRTEDIDFTVILTHIGFEADKKLAELLDPRWGVDIIIGDHSEFYQFSSGVRVVVSVSEKCVKELRFNGAPVPDDASLRIGLQGYHYKNMKQIFGLNEEDVSVKVLATNAMDVIDENMSHRELIVCPEDARWITV